MIKMLLLAVAMLHQSAVLAQGFGEKVACADEVENGTEYHEKKVAAKEFLKDNKYQTRESNALAAAEKILAKVPCDEVLAYLNGLKHAVDYLLENNFETRTSNAVKKSENLLTKIDHTEVEEFVKKFDEVYNFLRDERYAANKKQATAYTNLWFQKTHYSEAGDYIKKLRRLTDFAADKKTGLRKRSLILARNYALYNALAFCAEYALEDEFATHFNAFQEERGSNVAQSISRAYAVVRPHAFACAPAEEETE